MISRKHPSAMIERADEIAPLLKVLSHADRLRIALELLDGEMKVGELAARTKVAQPSLSRGLARFRAHGLVTTRRLSKEIYYAISDERLVRILNALEDAAANAPIPPSDKGRRQDKSTGPLRARPIAGSVHHEQGSAKSRRHRSHP
jgi:DNA-binding transcriptional ArsR family regulator